MGWRLAPLGRYLDVRTAASFLAEPILVAVNIPFDELPRRLHELPPKNETVEVLDTGPEADQAVSFLEKGGRTARLRKPSPPAPSPFSGEKGEGVHRLWRPNAFLEETLPKLASGHALDLGCGSGREAVAMAGAGFEVTAIDNLHDALEMGRELARRYLTPSPFSQSEKGEGVGGEGSGPPIEWILLDLESGLPPQTPLSFSRILKNKGGELYDLIASFRYLHRPLLAQIHDWLAPGGSFLLETFTALHRERHGKPRQDAHVLQLGEAPNLVPGLEIVHFDEAWRGEAHTARLWARKAMLETSQFHREERPQP